MGCCFEEFRLRWSVYFEARARGERVKATPALRSETLALMKKETMSVAELARHLKLPSRIIYHWQDIEKNKNKSTQTPGFHPIELQDTPAGLVLHTPRGYELQGLSLSHLRQWVEQGVL